VGETVRRWVPRLTVPQEFDAQEFYRRLLQNHGTYVGREHWFEMPRNYFCVGFGWPTADELRGGLKAISKALDDLI
jgi:DNA-binding transcriptional MocR family regulator